MPENRTVIISGGTRGIGEAIAIKLAQDGFNLILNYMKDHDKAKNTLNKLRQFNANVYTYQTDVSDYESVEKMVQFAVEKFNSIEVIINNAGINIDKSFVDMTENEWDKVIGVNLKGAFNLCHNAAKYMLKSVKNGKSIINIGATTAIKGRENGSNYCASKAGLMMMTKCLAVDLAPYIRVNTVIPGFTYTEETEKRFDLPDKLDYELKCRKIPLNKIGTPENISEMIAFLLSPKADYITGQKFIVDGGEFMF